MRPLSCLISVVLFACDSPSHSLQRKAVESAIADAGTEQPPPPDSRDGTYTFQSSISEPSVSPTFVDAQPYDLEHFIAVSQAVSVFVCTNKVSFLTDPNDPTSIKTRYDLETQRVVKGTPPSSVTVLGGELGNYRVLADIGRHMKIGTRYVGFFQDSSGVFSSTRLAEVNGTTFIIEGQSYDISSLPTVE